MARSAFVGAGVVLLSIAASAAALAHAQGPVPSGAQGESLPGEPEALHRVAADFVEDEPGSRVLAALEAQVLHSGERTWLRLSASPTGPRVNALPGASGVAGSNRLTAEEIDVALARERLAVIAHGPRGPVAGRAFSGESREVLVRRLREDGSVEHVAVPSREAWFEVDLDGVGLHEVEVRLDGRTRIRATVRRHAGGARTERLVSLSGHDGDRQ